MAFLRNTELLLIGWDFPTLQGKCLEVREREELIIVYKWEKEKEEEEEGHVQNRQYLAG